MQIGATALRVRIYAGESDTWHGKPLAISLLEYLRREGAAGATVFRGTAGFGAHSRIHTTSIVALSADLPILVEWTDSPERVERLLPEVRQMVQDGLITTETVTIVQYAAGRRRDALDMPASSVMRQDVRAVRTDAPLEEIVDLLLHFGYRSLPVVDGADRAVGMITDGDLLRRTGYDLRAVANEHPARLPLEHLPGLNLQAEAIMSHPPVTVSLDTPVRSVVATMLDHDVKRVLVVDGDGCLQGLISRVDLLRLAEYQLAEPVTTRHPPPPGRSIGQVMDTGVATVGLDAVLDEVITGLERSVHRRVVVVDPSKHVVGILTDGDVLRRSRHAAKPRLVSRLQGLITGRQDDVFRLPSDETAAQLMTAPVVSVSLGQTLYEAMVLMLQQRIKCLPVLDSEGRLVGILGRSNVMRGLLDVTSAGSPTGGDAGTRDPSSIDG